MSASLVGSEMCIRDRGVPRVMAHSPSRGEWGNSSEPSSAPDVPFRDGRAVSYTHLTLPTICSV
eukprot:15046416-Alexandrium_andersonii.AAC.1